MAAVDIDEFARRGRAVLRQAREATLLVPGAAAAGAVPVLHEMDGRPRFICPPDSTLSPQAVGRAAILQVGDGPLTVLLAGSLARVDAEWIDGIRVDVLELELASVMIEDGATSAVALVEIPIDTWLREDAMRACSERTLAHTNTAHARELRQFVARREGMCEAEIACVRLADLDATGVRVDWVDSRGAHTCRLGFGTAVRTPGQLGPALRAQLRS